MAMIRGHPEYERRKGASPPDWSMWSGRPSRVDLPCNAACAASMVESLGGHKGTVADLSDSHGPAVLGNEAQAPVSVSSLRHTGPAASVVSAVSDQSEMQRAAVYARPPGTACFGRSMICTLCSAAYMPVYLVSGESGRPENEVHPRVCLYDVAHLSHLESKRRVLEGLLHLSAPERSQVAAVRVRRAVRLGGCDLCELCGEVGGGQGEEVGLVLLELGDGFVLCARDHGLRGASLGASAFSQRQHYMYHGTASTHLLPRGRPAALPVLDEEVARLDRVRVGLAVEVLPRAREVDNVVLGERRRRLPDGQGL